MVECLLDSQNTGVRFPYRLPIFLHFCMLYQGVFSHRNLHTGEKVKDDGSHNNFHPGPGNHPPVQIITIDGIDYFVKMAGGNWCNDNRLNQFNNKTVIVEGSFVGAVMFITSITKVGP